MGAITAHTDENQNNTIIGVQGTLGTADVAGTALTLPISVNPDTGAMYVDIMGGEIIASLGTLDLLKAGTLNVVKDGTVSLLKSGTVKVIDSLAPYVYDTITAAYPSGSVEVYAYALGTTSLGSVSVTYTDATKGSISSVIKTP